MSTFLDTETGQGVDKTIVAGLITMLDKTSAIVQAFRMARNWLSEVATVITNDFGDGVPSRDIVVDIKVRGPKRILELHPSYMALQYLLLFPYREDGFHEKIPYHSNRGTRKIRNPNLFITFTSNPKWPKITEMLAFIPGHERPKVGTRVFKLKLTDQLDDLTKNEIFDKTYAVVYVIEFQKRSLPHPHILLWLEKEWKCKTPSQIDDIILTEIPSLTTDPEGYKVVT
ncbi:DNA helicase PIF1, ATP-dependent [Tanacetum coccineum]